MAPCYFSGPAHVPMMSPNGSMPPIFVPPGYVSQVNLNLFLHFSMFVGVAFYSKVTDYFIWNSY